MLAAKMARGKPITTARATPRTEIWMVSRAGRNVNPRNSADNAGGNISPRNERSLPRPSPKSSAPGRTSARRQLAAIAARKTKKAMNRNADLGGLAGMAAGDADGLTVRDGGE